MGEHICNDITCDGYDPAIEAASPYAIGLVYFELPERADPPLRGDIEC